MTRSRSKSRSPRRERRRKSRDGEESRDRDRRRKHRTKSRSPRHHKSSHSHRARNFLDDEVIYTGTSHINSETGELPPRKKRQKNVEVIPEQNTENMDEDEIKMMQAMGFTIFATTKGKQVEGNDIYHANLIHKRKYRQYMNRRGGFNRPLDFIA